MSVYISLQRLPCVPRFPWFHLIPSKKPRPRFAKRRSIKGQQTCGGRGSQIPPSLFATRTALRGKLSCGRLGKPIPLNSTYAVPPNRMLFCLISAAQHCSVADSFLSFLKTLRRPACGITTSLPSQMLTLPSQPPAITLFNPFYPRAFDLTPRPFPTALSTSFHQKSPAIPHIPLNSTYAVPPKSTQVPDFFVFHRRSHISVISVPSPSVTSVLLPPPLSRPAPAKSTFATQVLATANSARFNRHMNPFKCLATAAVLCVLFAFGLANSRGAETLD